MKHSVGILPLVVLAGLTLAISACSGPRKNFDRFVPTVAAENLQPTPAQTNSTNLAGLAPTPQQTVQEERMLDPKTLKAQVEKDERSVFFDYDSATVRSDYGKLLQAIADEVNRSGIKAVRVEGNTDARGSREYNLALGQRRANSVKASISALGVAPNAINAISYGKEKLLAPGEDEESHAINRRADILYQGEY